MLILSKVLIREIREIRGYYYFVSSCFRGKCFKRKFLCIELKWFTNFFQPSVKLVKKVRIGSKLKRIYNKPKTPFQRVCECKEVDSEKIAQLKKVFLSLDPFELSQTIEKKLTKIQSLATKITKFQRTYLPKYSEEETVLYSSNPWLHS
ncbi:MAG: hypothetical protein AUJ76_02350 [Candidatus Omnitrophica bacterium CG1_02_41_171]|nr:MAG: hypothetical protein AUJ76_02350 [Candidatus Omnitrophica bacterium CG1_02_41_171]